METLFWRQSRENIWTPHSRQRKYQWHYTLAIELSIDASVLNDEHIDLVHWDLRIKYITVTNQAASYWLSDWLIVGDH